MGCTSLLSLTKQRTLYITCRNMSIASPYYMYALRKTVTTPTSPFCSRGCRIVVISFGNITKKFMSRCRFSYTKTTERKVCFVGKGGNKAVISSRFTFCKFGKQSRIKEKRRRSSPPPPIHINSFSPLLSSTACFNKIFIRELRNTSFKSEKNSHTSVQF